MKQRKRKLPTRPAETLANYEPLRHIEQGARELYHIKKIFVQDGREAALEALGELVSNGDDPSSASAVASAGVYQIAEQLDSFQGSQLGRSTGGRTRAKQRKDESEKDYRKIRDRATALLASGKDSRDIAGIIMQITGHSRPKVMRALTAHQSGHWGRRKRNAS